MNQLDLGFGADYTDRPGRVAHPALADAEGVLNLLRRWQDAGWLQALDTRFAIFLHQQCPEASGLLLLAAALASHQLARGHVCLDLGATLARPAKVLDLPPERLGDEIDALDITPAVLLEKVSIQDWESALHPQLVSDGSRVAPLLYDKGRLYLYRYWQYERKVAHGVAARLRPADETPVPAVRVARILNVLFGTPDPAEPDWQRIACALAVRSRFSVITGGPGTGKTTTVIRLLALLQALHFEQAANSGMSSVPGLRIRLAAPTGKAAARLTESIAGRIESLPFDALPGGRRLADTIPAQVTTLHALLGKRPHSRKQKFNADQPLPLDVLVIDESSMVSLSDMADVMDALPEHARLVLIGDKDQLASVEAGAVLGELCRRAEGGHYPPDLAQWLHAATGIPLPSEFVHADGGALDQTVAMLRLSYRFDKESGIGRLAQAVNMGDAESALELLASPPADLAYLQGVAQQDDAFRRCLVEGSADGRHEGAAAERRGLRHFLEIVKAGPPAPDPAAHDAWALQVLQAHRSCQVLCVLREGHWGVKGLNLVLAKMLRDLDLIPAANGWYPGRPVMVTRNNWSLGLANGDIGIVLPYPAGEGEPPLLKVAFSAGDGRSVRWFAPNRLDDVETVYALTVHKSQGSEFDHAVVILPPAATPVLTRELLYTGITRASRWFTLINPGTHGLVRHTIQERVYRSGGLGELLHALR